MNVHQTLVRPAASPAEQRFLDLYEDVAGRLPGAQNPDVRAWREGAMEAFALRGLPHRRVEEWKYTDLRVLMPEVYPLAGLAPQSAAGIDLDAAVGADLANLDAYRAVFVNGMFRADLSNAADVPGLLFNSFRAAIGSQCASMVLEKVEPRSGDIVSALAAAFATDGALAVIEDGVALAKPLHLIFIVTGDSPVAVGLQNVLKLGKGAEATLIETHCALLPSQCFAVTRIEAEESARLSHVRVNIGNGKHLSSVVAELGAKAQYDPVQVMLGGALTRAQSFIRFAGGGARCHYTGASMLRGSEHGDMTLVVDHDAVGCESRELAKAVLDGRAHGVFQAKVVVRRGAQKTDGKQMSNALLLSNDAEFDSKPELEIYADDVVCGHGATAGQLDEDLMFYLRARGLPEAEARALLIVAFIGEALDKIEDETLRDALRAKTEDWLAA
jgi:Fe-S cluster assembly protein SufD